MDKFFAKRNSTVEKQISATELTLCYHTVHHFSFRSNNCTTKLNATIFKDSEIATKITLARTKLESIIKGILGPFIYNTVLEEVQKVPFVGVLTDGSNHKDIKLFPVVIQYFNIEQNGLQNKLLEIQSLTDVKAITITDLLTKVMTKAKCFEKCVAFGGDNCNTNFGSFKHSGSNNVFNLLKTKRKYLEGSRCPAHVINNCIQHAVNCLKH